MARLEAWPFPTIHLCKFDDVAGQAVRRRRSQAPRCRLGGPAPGLTSPVQPPRFVSSAPAFEPLPQVLPRAREALLSLPSACNNWCRVQDSNSRPTVYKSVDRGVLLSEQGGAVPPGPQLHPVVLPHVSHFKHVPLRTKVKFPHSPHASPS
jgi:hypothetical protein